MYTSKKSVSLPNMLKLNILRKLMILVIKFFETSFGTFLNLDSMLFIKVESQMFIPCALNLIMNA